jgi:hypothetical protein
MDCGGCLVTLLCLASLLLRSALSPSSLLLCRFLRMLIPDRSRTKRSLVKYAGVRHLSIPAAAADGDAAPAAAGGAGGGAGAGAGAAPAEP